MANDRRRCSRHFDAGTIRPADGELLAFTCRLLGASPATQFCTVLVRPRAGQRAETLGPALSKAVTQLDSNVPTYFAGTAARLHDEILSGNRIIVSLFAIFGGRRVRSFRGWSLRRDEFFGEPAHTGVWNSNGAGSGCAPDFPNGHDAGRVAAGHRLVLGAGGAALLLGVLVAAALRNILFKVNALDPSIYFAVAGTADNCCRAFLFYSRAPRYARRSRGGASL